MIDLTDRQWRHVQALKDFGQALSALTFFMEIPERTNRIDRKRYRCFHDASIVTYCRPFKRSNGLPKLTLDSVNVQASVEENELHEFLMEQRDKVVAHTDTARMRLLLTSFDVGEEIRFPYVVEDEGFALLGKEKQFEAWLHKLTHSLSTEVFHLMQDYEAGTRFLKDYLNPVGAEQEPKDGSSAD